MDGVKTAVRDGSGVSGYDYLGSFVFLVQNGIRSLESIGFQGGRIYASQSGNTPVYTPFFHITDHLASVRFVINGSSGEVEELNNYYPFGKRWNDQNMRFTNNRRVFNGKEQQTVGQLPYIDYGVRMYDPRIGRWFNVDREAEKYFSISPYVYCENNPVNVVDPDGTRTDWIKTRTTLGEDASLNYVWDDEAVSPETTPEGYTYVGENDSDILRDMNIKNKYVPQSDKRYGWGIDGNDSPSGATHVISATRRTAYMNAEAVVSISPQNATSNNRLGRRFEGVKFSAGFTQTPSCGNKDFEIDYKGKFQVTYGATMYYSNLFEMTRPHLREEGSISKEASMVFPASALNSKDSFSKGAIVTGATNSNLIVISRPADFVWPLMLRP